MCRPDDFAALPAFLSFVCEMCWLIRAIDIKWPPGPLKWPRRSSLKHWERQAASSTDLDKTCIATTCARHARRLQKVLSCQKVLPHKDKEHCQENRWHGWRVTWVTSKPLGPVVSQGSPTVSVFRKLPKCLRITSWAFLRAWHQKSMTIETSWYTPEVNRPWKMVVGRLLS